MRQQHRKRGRERERETQRERERETQRERERERDAERERETNQRQEKTGWSTIRKRSTRSILKKTECEGRLKAKRKC